MTASLFVIARNETLFVIASDSEAISLRLRTSNFKS